MSELLAPAQVYLNEGGNKRHQDAIEALDKIFPSRREHGEEDLCYGSAQIKFSFDTADEDDCMNIGIRYTDDTEYQTEEIFFMSILGLEDLEAIRDYFSLAIKHISAERLERQKDLEGEL
jgi:hypothetical protein